MLLGPFVYLIRDVPILEPRRSTLPVRLVENPPSNLEIRSTCALKDRWIKTDTFSLNVPFVELHATIKVFPAGARLSKIAHLIEESVRTQICRSLQPISQAPLRLLPRL